jgi:hypothetical protein
MKIENDIETESSLIKKHKQLLWENRNDFIMIDLGRDIPRQLKSHQNLALKNDLRIVKILLVAPEFSDDFVTDCEMDTEMNLSLITASTLSNILEAFKSSKYTEFPHVLFRDIMINEERILKALSK